MSETLSAHSDRWKIDFLNESENIREILKDKLIETHHIGSTAITSILAKPKIDIACIVSDLDASRVLEQHGYVFKGEFNIPFRYFFSKKGEVSANLHVMLPGNHELQNFLNFRDYLNSDKEARKIYSDFKRTIESNLNSQKADSMFNDYTMAKNKIVAELIKKSGFKGICMRFVAHYLEQEYEKIQCVKNELQTNPNDVRVVLYQGANIIGYAQGRGNSITFIKSEAFLDDFRNYFQSYLNWKNVSK
ncbi:MAG: GrpB family protein [Alphaproteobacteria bacterium]|nr:GrpB family protein [Alphaproteobacteria bacterium]